MQMDTEKLSPLRNIAIECVCGLLWITDIALLASLTRRVDELVSYVRRGAEAVATMKLPDEVVMFAAAVVGIVLPYTVAVVFKPLSVLVSNWLLPPLRKRLAHDQVTAAHREAVQKAVTDETGIEIPDWWAFFLELYLAQKQSPNLTYIREYFDRAQALMQSALPVGLLVALTISLLGRTALFMVMGAVSGSGAFLLLIKAAIDTHMRWDNAVVFSFLLLRGEREAAPEFMRTTSSETISVLAIPSAGGDPAMFSG